MIIEEVPNKRLQRFLQVHKEALEKALTHGDLWSGWLQRRSWMAINGYLGTLTDFATLLFFEEDMTGFRYHRDLLIERYTVVAQAEEVAQVHGVMALAMGVIDTVSGPTIRTLRPYKAAPLPDLVYSFVVRVVFPLVLCEAKEAEEGIIALEAACQGKQFNRVTCERYAFWAEMARAILRRDERSAEDVQASLAAQYHERLVRELKKADAELLAAEFIDWETNALAEIGRQRGMQLDTLSRRLVVAAGSAEP